MNTIKIRGADVQAQLSVFVYQDNDYPGGVYIAYCPELDLAGCDDTEEGARKSFEIVMNDYFEDTIAKGTLEKDLLVHGWRKKNGKMANPTYPALFRKGKLNDVFGRSEFKKFSIAIGA